MYLIAGNSFSSSIPTLIIQTHINIVKDEWNNIALISLIFSIITITSAIIETINDFSNSIE